MSSAAVATREPPVWTDDRITAVLFLLVDTQYGYLPSTVAVVRELMPQVGALFEHGMVVSRAPYTVCWPGLSLLIPPVFRVARPTALTFFLLLSFSLSLSLSIPHPPSFFLFAAQGTSRPQRNQSDECRQVGLQD